MWRLTRHRDHVKRGHSGHVFLRPNNARTGVGSSIMSKYKLDGCEMDKRSMSSSGTLRGPELRLDPRQGKQIELGSRRSHSSEKEYGSSSDGLQSRLIVGLHPNRLHKLSDTRARIMTNRVQHLFALTRNIIPRRFVIDFVLDVCNVLPEFEYLFPQHTPI